jgi:hypothetical protein
MSNTRIIRNLILTLFIVATSYAKITDPNPIIENGIKYQSHDSYIEAIDTMSNKEKWHSELYSSMYPSIPIPFMEQDVQWNIVSKFSISHDTIIVLDSKGNRYYVDKFTGTVIGQIPAANYHFGMIFIILISVFTVVIIRRKKRLPT